jgi:thiol-activated cytolysin
MKQLTTLLTLMAMLIAIGCSESGTDPSKTAKDIDELVRNAGIIDKSVQHSTIEGETKDTVVNDYGKKWNLKETKWNIARNLGEAILPFGKNANTMWAGALVQGKEVPNGILNSLGDDIPRAPITITVNSGSGHFGSAEIEKPTNATYSKALDDILKNNVTKATAQQTLTVKYAYSKEQACMEMGFSANWIAGQFNSNFETTNTAERKSVYLLFKQVYYTVSVNEPSRPSNYFADNAKPDDISYYLESGYPMCYVSSVDYGRIILVKMTYEGNIKTTELEADVQAAFGKYEAHGSYNTDKLVGKTTFQGLILGGTGGGAARALTSENRSLDGIISLIKDEAEYIPDIQAYPISYTVKNLADNSIVKLGETTEYTVKEYTESDENYQDFKVTFEGFWVITDCEPVGVGNFYYDIYMIDNEGNNLLSGSINVPKEQTIPAGNNNWVYIKGKKEHSFKLSKNKSSYFTVFGTISEYNNIVDDIELDFDQRFNFPWNKEDIDNGWQITGTPGYYGIEMFRDEKCKLVLLLKIEKL